MKRRRQRESVIGLAHFLRGGVNVWIGLVLEKVEF